MVPTPSPRPAIGCPARDALRTAEEQNDRDKESKEKGPTETSTFKPPSSDGNQLADHSQLKLRVWGVSVSRLCARTADACVLMSRRMDVCCTLPSW
jgi:hypothetical protein